MTHAQAALPVQPVQSVTLAWTPSADPNVVGYRIYDGAASRTYTNMADVGNKLAGTISNLFEGTTYYFAATAYNILGLESDFSGEISYTVPIGSTNHPPTLNLISNVTVSKNAGLQTVNLTGITSGASNEIQTLTVTAVSGNPGLIPNPAITYTSPNSTGTLRFTPVTNGLGNATVSVTVNDGGASNNILTRSFTVTVTAVIPAPGLQIRITPARQIILTLTGQAGHTNDILATQNFTAWTVIGTVTLGTNGSIEFTDTNAASFPARYYRTRENP